MSKKLLNKYLRSRPKLLNAEERVKNASLNFRDIPPLFPDYTKKSLIVFSNRVKHSHTDYDLILERIRGMPDYKRGYRILNRIFYKEFAALYGLKWEDVQHLYSRKITGYDEFH